MRHGQIWTNEEKRSKPNIKSTDKVGDTRRKESRKKIQGMIDN